MSGFEFVPDSLAAPDERPLLLQDVEAEILDAAPLGDVQSHRGDRPPPDGWLITDGARLRASDYPAFVQEMGIESAEFELPNQVAMPGYVLIIKVGERRV